MIVSVFSNNKKRAQKSYQQLIYCVDSAKEQDIVYKLFRARARKFALQEETLFVFALPFQYIQTAAPIFTGQEEDCNQQSFFSIVYQNSPEQGL